MSCLHPQVLTEAAHGSSLAGLQRLLRSYTRYAPRLVEDAFRTYHNVLSALPGRWERLLPPYDRVAVLLGGTDILTFDGTLLHIPKTRCKVHIVNITRLFQVIFDKASNLHDTVMNIKMLSLRS